MACGCPSDVGCTCLFTGDAYTGGSGDVGDPVTVENVPLVLSSPNNTIDISQSGTKDHTAELDVAISADADNAIELAVDGLLVDKCSIVKSTRESSGDILIADSGGDCEAERLALPISANHIIAASGGLWGQRPLISADAGNAASVGTDGGVYATGGGGPGDDPNILVPILTDDLLPSLVPGYSWLLPSPLAAPTPAPSTNTLCAEWSPNGRFLAVGSTDAPRLRVYERSGNTLTEVAIVSSPPASSVASLRWSPDGTLLCASLGSSPGFALYELTKVAPTTGGSSLALVARTVPTLGTSSLSCAWSPCGQYLAVGSNSAPHVRVFRRSGRELDTTQMSISGTAPEGSPTGLDWSPDSKILSFSMTASPYFGSVLLSDNTLTRLPNPADLPAGAGQAVSWSPEGTVVSVAHTTTPFVTTYSRSGSTLSKVADPATLPAGNGNGVRWSPLGRALVVTHSSGDNITVYDWDGSTFAAQPSPVVLPGVPAFRTPSWSPDGRLLSLTQLLNPDPVYVYETSGLQPNINDSSLPLQYSAFEAGRDEIRTVDRKALEWMNLTRVKSVQVLSATGQIRGAGGSNVLLSAGGGGTATLPAAVPGASLRITNTGAGEWQIQRDGSDELVASGSGLTTFSLTQYCAIELTCYTAGVWWVSPIEQAVPIAWASRPTNPLNGQRYRLIYGSGDAGNAVGEFEYQLATNRWLWIGGQSLQAFDATLQSTASFAYVGINPQVTISATGWVIAQVRAAMQNTNLDSFTFVSVGGVVAAADAAAASFGRPTGLTGGGQSASVAGVTVTAAGNIATAMRASAGTASSADRSLVVTPVYLND